MTEISQQLKKQGENRPNILILICTYNEIESVPTLVGRIREIVPDADVLVVDDQSPDGTGEWVDRKSDEDPKVRSLRRIGKLGLGSAIRDGIEFAIQNGYQLVVNLDADLSHDPDQIPELIAMNERTESAITIGSRYVAGGGMANCSWKRHLVSRCANLYARMLLGLRAKDCSSAYRCYRLSLIRQLPLQEIVCTGYGFLEEILWWAKKFRLPVNESPIIYTERELGESKISIGEAIGTMQTIHRLWWRKWYNFGDIPSRKIPPT